MPVTPSDIPLCVDLDGTLIHTDLLWESLCALLASHPRQFPLAFLWLISRGKAFLKRKLAETVSLDVSLLPYNALFIAWLSGQRAQGRRIVLATASDEILARRVAEHLGIFDEVLASDGVSNLKGSNKAALLHARFGGAFDYAGNSASDWKIWRECRQIVAVDTPLWLTRRLEKSGRLAESFRTNKPRILVWSRALRLHQWVKNVLIFLPIIAAHKGLDPARLIPTLIGFFSFSLMASATYLINDLMDLAPDRMHPRKRFRPLAAGELSIPAAVTGAFALFFGGLALSGYTGVLVVPFLILLYFITSLAYSLSLKRVALFDVYVLSGLYTLRIVVGSETGDIPLSGWFLSFAIFLFLSLGFAKRAAEMHRTGSPPQVPGRGYSAIDFQTVTSFGISAAFAAALVLGLYMQSASVQVLYRHPQPLWGIFPICLYWLTRIWLMTSRGLLQEDPVSFAIRDRITWLLLGVCVVILRVAT